MSAATPYVAARPGRRQPDLVGLFCDQLARLLADRVDALAIDRGGEVPAELRRELAELGVFGVSIPEDWGGAGLGLPGACAVVRTLARADRSVATTVGLHLGLGTRPLVAFGDDAQRARWLPDLATGHHLAAFSTTEAGAGSDLSRFATRATQLPADKRLRLDGTKVFVTNGGWADIFTVAASTGTLGGVRRGQSLLIVERGDPGVRSGPEEHKLGLRGSSTTSLYFDGVELPLERVLGRPGHAHQQLNHALAWGRTVMASGCLGTAEAALDAARRHVIGRHQFSRPLATLPVIRSQLADAAAERFTMEALVAATAGSSGAALERRSLVAKIYCSEADWRLCDLALQLHGGSGYIEDTGVPLLLRDARITRIFEGANDVLLTHLGALELITPTQPDQGRGDAGGLLADLVSEARAEITSRFGVRALGQPRRLHALGHLTLLREAVAACARHDHDDESLRTRAIELLRRQRWVRRAPGDDDAAADTICDAFLSQGQR